MRLLWDTHTFLWFVTGSDQLSNAARATIEAPSSEHYISIASLWEISIKTALGKLTIHGPYESVMEDVAVNGIHILPISFSHTVQQNKLPFLHRDPFDRILISQALVEEMHFISKDSAFDAYLLGHPIRRIW